MKNKRGSSSGRHFGRDKYREIECISREREREREREGGQCSGVDGEMIGKERREPRT